MMEVDAVLGGEESGGFGFRGHIPERDGILAGLFFADMILHYQKPLSEILAGLMDRVGPHFYERRDIHLPRESYDHDREVILKTMREHEPKEIAGTWQKMTTGWTAEPKRRSLDDPPPAMRCCARLTPQGR